MVKHKFLIEIMLLLGLAFFANDACAMEVYDNVLKNLEGSLVGLKDKLMKAGVWLFWTLALIGLAVQGARAVFQGDGITSGASILVRWLIVTGFFWMLIMNGGELLIDKGVKLFADWGDSMGSFGKVTSPTEMVNLGMDAIWGGEGYDGTSFMDQSQIAYKKAPKASFIGVNIEAGIAYIFRFLLALFITLFIVILGFNMFMIMANMYCILYLGLFLVGLAGAEFTRNMAMPYLKTALSAGIKVLTMVLVVQIGFDMLLKSINKLTSSIGGDGYFEASLECLVTAYLFYLVGSKIPDMIAGLVGGIDMSAGTVDAGKAAGSVMSFGAKAAGAGVAVGAIAAGAGAAAAAGKFSGSAAAQTASKFMSGALKGLAPSKLTNILESGKDAVRGGTKEEKFREAMLDSLDTLNAGQSGMADSLSEISGKLGK